MIIAFLTECIVIEIVYIARTIVNDQINSLTILLQQEDPFSIFIETEFVICA